MTRGRLAALLAAVAVAAWCVLAADAAAPALRDAAAWCRAAGAAGVAAFALLYAASTLALLPAAVLTVAAGSIWGLFWGTVIVQAVSVVADWIPFVIARRLGRARLRRWLDRGHAPALDALDAAMRAQGFKLVCLLRLSPVAPYNVMNYLLGLTPVSTPTYLVASAIGSTPPCLAFVWAGTLAAGGAGAPALRWIGFALTAVSAVGLVWVARREVRRALGGGADQSVFRYSSSASRSSAGSASPKV